MAQQTKYELPPHGSNANRSKSRHGGANQNHTIDLGAAAVTRQNKNAGGVMIQQTATQQNAYQTAAVGGGQANTKKGSAASSKAQDKKLTQNFMKVPRGGAAGLIGGPLDGQAGYLVKQQQLMNNQDAQQQTNSQRLLEAHNE